MYENVNSFSAEIKSLQKRRTTYDFMLSFFLRPFPYKLFYIFFSLFFIIFFIVLFKTYLFALFPARSIAIIIGKLPSHAGRVPLICDMHPRVESDAFWLLLRFYSCHMLLFADEM